MERPTIVVTNGTANEGYWSVYYLLKTGRFNVRATVRRPTSAQAKRLGSLNFDGNRCEIVQASTEDQAALSAAFDGADGIYGTTIYNIHAKKYRADNPEEMAQGLALIAAAKACKSLKHFVFQTMTRFETTPEDRGLESPIHFRTKWSLEELAQNEGLPWILLRQPAYMRQIKFGIRRNRKLVFPYPPRMRLSFVAEEDIGKLVAAIFANADDLLHKTVKAVSEVLTPNELAARAHALLPEFSPNYRKATALETAIFDYIVVGMKPAFRYVTQINRNLAAGNPFDIDLDDKVFCENLISPLKLTEVEEWLSHELDGIKDSA